MLDIITNVVEIGCRNHADFSEDAAALIMAVSLVRLTAYPRVSNLMSELYDDDPPDEVPDFEGNVGDLVAVTALKFAGDRLTTSQVSWVHLHLVELLVCTFENVSPFTDGFCSQATDLLFAFLERCCKALSEQKTPHHIALWLPRLLEAVANALQYQYNNNQHVVYGLLTRQDVFADMMKFVYSLKAPADASEAAKDGSEWNVQWRQEIKDALVPIRCLMKHLLPIFESDENADVPSADDAKKLLPKSMIGFLPMPHRFSLRDLPNNAFTHRISQASVITLIANGPLSVVWEQKDDVQKTPLREPTPLSSAKPSAGKQEKKLSKGAKGRNTGRRANGKQRPERGQPAQTRTPSQPQGISAEAPAPAGTRATPRGQSTTAPVAAPAVAVTQEPAPVAAMPSLAEQLKAAADAGIDITALLSQVQGLKAQAESGNDEGGI